MIGLPSSETATMPASCISPISARRSPCEADGHGADRVDAGQLRGGRLLDDVLGHRAGVVHRIGVRHARDRGEAAGHRRLRRR